MEGSINIRAHEVLPPGSRPFIKKLELQGEFDIAHAQWGKPRLPNEAE
jgi:hypothetical protein